MIVTVMEVGLNRETTVPAVVPVMTTGVVAIVPRIIRMIVAGMEVGRNQRITVAVVVPVVPAGVVAIVPKNPVAGMGPGVHG